MHTVDRPPSCDTARLERREASERTNQLRGRYRAPTRPPNPNDRRLRFFIVIYGSSTRLLLYTTSKSYMQRTTNSCPGRLCLIGNRRTVASSIVYTYTFASADPLAFFPPSSFFLSFFPAELCASALNAQTLVEAIVRTKRRLRSHRYESPGFDGGRVQESERQ